MNLPYPHEETATERAQKSSLWPNLEKQYGETLPYLLERYLLLENWRYMDRCDAEVQQEAKYEFGYLHLLLADLASVVLFQEERIRQLEQNLKPPATSHP